MSIGLSPLGAPAAQEPPGPERVSPSLSYPPGTPGGALMDDDTRREAME